MKTILGLTAATAGFLLASSAAFAADDGACHGGYRVIAGTPIVCDSGATFAPMRATGPVDEPLHTGSIAAPTVGAAAHSGMMMVSGPTECRPGAYWLMDNPNQDTPIACPR